MVSGLFITGTDTGVGKTHVSCALAQAWRVAGHGVGVMKPVETGVGDPGGPGPDVLALTEAAGADDPLSEVCPYRFALPASPRVAARAVNASVELGTILTAFTALATRHERMVVEGAGGWAVPLAAGLEMGDLAQALGLPVVVVARRGLGTVNHTLLTVRAIRASGLTVAAVVLNGPEEDASVVGNAELIRECAKVVVFDGLPWGEEADATALAQAAWGWMAQPSGPG